MTPMEWVENFHDGAGVKTYTEMNDKELQTAASLRYKLIREESNEVMAELIKVTNGRWNVLEVAKELADLLVVVYGTADVFGIPLDAVFDEVMKSNMSKLEGMELREDGKILKGPNYQPPDLYGVLSNRLSI